MRMTRAETPSRLEPARGGQAQHQRWHATRCGGCAAAAAMQPRVASDMGPCVPLCTSADPRGWSHECLRRGPAAQSRGRFIAIRGPLAGSGYAPIALFLHRPARACSASRAEGTERAALRPGVCSVEREVVLVRCVRSQQLRWPPVTRCSFDPCTGAARQTEQRAACGRAHPETASGCARWMRCGAGPGER